MIGRTNVIFGSSSGSGGSGGVTTVDLPTCPASISANGANQYALLTLAYNNTNFITGVQVNYKTESYPESPNDGDFITVEGAAESIRIDSLTNSLTYYFRVFLYREVDGIKYYQTDVTNTKITAIPRSVEIFGITPLVAAADHLVVVNSGTFTLTANAGTKLIIGSAGDGTSGGYVAEYTLSNDIVEESCTLTVASTRASNASKIIIGSTTYGCGSTVQIIQSKWGPIGGNGGHGGGNSDGGNGTGAGGGGGGPTYHSAGSGGNRGGYGNYGGHGGRATSGEDGASGKGGQIANHGGSGGGGGYAAGGGRRGTFYGVDFDDYGADGSPGMGILVIQWDI